MIKVKNSTFNPNIMNCRKIRILTTIDPFWDISFGQRSGEIFFLNFFHRKCRHLWQQNDVSFDMSIRNH